MENPVRFVLLDIEGTISDIDFVKNVLFPYSAKHLRSTLEARANEPAINAVIQDAGGGDLEKAHLQLQEWIHQDVKHPALKSIQGIIWKKGFEGGEFKAPLYKDVLPQLTQWREKGIRLGIYSSGSKQAQDLFFKHTEYGNVLHFFEAQFDLSIGSKVEADSYTKIAFELQELPESILFLSDNPKELDAAVVAGMRVYEILRKNVSPSGRHPYQSNLIEILSCPR